MGKSGPRRSRLALSLGGCVVDGRRHHSAKGTVPVSAYPEGASVYGCCHMLGNVQEWTSTLWGSDPNKNALPIRIVLTMAGKIRGGAAAACGVPYPSRWVLPRRVLHCAVAPVVCFAHQ